MKYFTLAIQKYIQFKGRSTRKEFWLFVLFCFIFGIAFGLIDSIFGLQLGVNNIGILSTLFSLFTFLPGLAVTVRRLHDTGRSGWTILPTFLVFFPVTNKIGLALVVLGVIADIVIIIFACSKSDSDNKYGPNPHTALNA